jgi:colanic acid biosynthesis glycosyl transferase WcaI
VVLLKGVGKDSLPSKSFSILASGRPILASVDEDSDLAKLILRSQSGICVPPEDPMALAEAILSLKDDHPRCMQMGQNGRGWVEKYNSPQAAASKFELIFHSILRKTNISIN